MDGRVECARYLASERRTPSSSSEPPPAVTVARVPVVATRQGQTGPRATVLAWQQTWLGLRRQPLWVAGPGCKTAGQFSLESHFQTENNMNLVIAISVKWSIRKIQMSYQKVYNFTTYPNMSLIHAFEW